MKRQVILVPAPDDFREGAQRYYENFVYRVKHALETEGLDCEVYIVPPVKAPK